MRGVISPFLYYLRGIYTENFCLHPQFGSIFGTFLHHLSVTVSSCPYQTKDKTDIYFLTIALVVIRKMPVFQAFTPYSAPSWFTVDESV